MDLHTLHIEHTVALGLYTVLTIVNSWLHRGMRGVHWFPVYNLFAFAGALLIALRGHIPDSISIVMGCVFFPLAYLFLSLSLTDFFGEGSGRGLMRWQAHAVFALAVFLWMIQYGVLHPNTANRLLFYSLILSIQLALIAQFVFRRASGTLRVSGQMMGIIVALMSLSNVVRLVGVMLHGAPKNYLNSGSFLAMMVLNNSVLQGGVTVAFVWMTAAVLRQDLHVQANTDPLTGLLNRRAMEQAAEQKWASCRQRQLPLSAILIDLDEFKKINDSYGHHVGDLTLMEVAHCLQQHLRSDDVLARLGGDEFVVLLPDTPSKQAGEIAMRLRESLDGLKISCQETQIVVHASFGIAQAEDASFNWGQMLLHCDKALYAVKENGGNGIRSADTDLAYAQ